MKGKNNTNYLKCPSCANTLPLSYKNKRCPNPLCGFNFRGLEAFVHTSDIFQLKELKDQIKSPESHKNKLIITAIKFHMYTYVTHFIECSSGAHYNTIFKYFIKEYLDDLNVLKKILSSEYIKEGKSNTLKSKNGYKMYWGLYKYLIKVRSKNIRDFLKTEFPILYIKYRRLS